MRKLNFIKKISFYALIIITGWVSGYITSLNIWNHPNNESTSGITYKKKQDDSISPEKCLIKKVRKTAKKYGFDDLNENNWNDFVGEVKKQHLELLEKSMGVNYFQIITLSGDISKADRYFSMSKADINQADMTGMTPIAYAARNLDLNAVKALHRYGADLSLPVMHIPRYKHGHKVYMQLKYPYYPLETPLKMAILQNDPVNTPEIIRYFLDNGVKFTNGNDYILTALHNIEVMKEFIPEILDNTDLQKGIIPERPNAKTKAVSKIFQFDQNGSAIDYLFEKGLSPEIHEDDYFPVLNAAIFNGRNSPEIIQRLIDAGFDVNKTALSPKDDKIHGWLTPLKYAIRSENIEITEILLKNGACISTEAFEEIKKFPEDKKNKFLNLFKKYGALN
ncbi:MAG: hypothetical protein CSA18_01030 [Deltaproteobacteria bacterium]|nr:MAG: hypothetical protein CSA18_01030 [Deltaproteobacteria bacterium]